VAQLCAAFEVMPTFMAKFNASLPGSSGHLHQSLWSMGKKPQNLFYDAKSKDKLSALAKSYLAGQLHHMPAFTALLSPTINSYKRYVPGVWAPLTASWGFENRTCAIRVIGAKDAYATRVEYRQTAADINPYIAMATSLAAGLYGIERELDPPPPASGDASTGGEVHKPLPRTLSDATKLLASSKVAREILGAPFVDHYVRTRDWEVRQYERAVSDWELLFICRGRSDHDRRALRPRC